MIITNFYKLSFTNQFMKKRNCICNHRKIGQVSIFIVLGVMIIFGVAIFLFFGGDLLKNIKVSSSEAKAVHDFTQDCIKQTGIEAIYQVGQTGGYYVTPKESYITDFSSENNIAYYLLNGENLIPSKGKVQEELSQYVDEFTSSCIDDFYNFEGIQISAGEIQTKTKIEEDKVIFDVFYPIKITKEDRTYSYKDFRIEVPVRLGYIYDTAYEIMESQMEKTDAICISCLKRISDEKGISVNMFEGGNKNVIFGIRDEKSKIYDGAYMFYFVNNYGAV